MEEKILTNLLEMNNYLCFSMEEISFLVEWNGTYINRWQRTARTSTPAYGELIMTLYLGLIEFQFLQRGLSA